MKDYHGDDHSWLQTYTGRQFWSLDPRPEDVDLHDIAHALALKCRYTGHCKAFYSVAQHSIIGARQAGSVELARWFLMHDAGEAYLFDAARPIKHAIPQIKEIEERIMRCVAERFGLPWPEPPGVKEIDNRMLMTERRDLMATPPRPWTVRAEPYPFTIYSEPWEKCEAAFTEMAESLGF